MQNETKIDWVSGKGGVGKSTFAYMLAQRYASKNKKTLLIEIGDKSFFSYATKSPIDYEPTSIEKNLYIAHWQWRICLKEYVTHLMKVKSLVDVFFENPVMKNIVSVAPGLSELSILGKLTSGLRNVGPDFEWDQIVFDAHSTGHTLSYMRAPRALHETIGVGPLGQHAKGIDKILTESDQVKYHLVSLPEEMPTQESLEFQKKVKEEFGVDFQITMNQVHSDKLLDSSKSPNPEFQEFVRHKKSVQETALKKIGKDKIHFKIPFIGKKQDYTQWVKNLREATSGMA